MAGIGRFTLTDNNSNISLTISPLGKILIWQKQFPLSTCHTRIVPYISPENNTFLSTSNDLTPDICPCKTLKRQGCLFTPLEYGLESVASPPATGCFDSSYLHSASFSHSLLTFQIRIVLSSEAENKR